MFVGGGTSPMAGGRLVLAAAGGRFPGLVLRAWGRGGTVSGSVLVRPSP